MSFVYPNSLKGHSTVHGAPTKQGKKEAEWNARTVNHPSTVARYENVQSASLKRFRSEVNDNPGPPAKKVKDELQVEFVYGPDDHIETYAACIDKAEYSIIIASWNLNFIPRRIFTSLMQAKKRGVPISFVVESVIRKETLKHFEVDKKKKDDDSTDYSFSIVETKSHAKFLSVQNQENQILILGSYNALGDAYESSEDASVILKGTTNQVWPYFMSLYESYMELDREKATEIFGGIAAISQFKNPGIRPLLQRTFSDSSKIFLLRNIQEHEDFFKQATPYNGDITIYSPFSTKDNTLNRLKTLEKILPVHLKVYLKILPEFKNGLFNLLDKVPNLKNRVTVQTTHSHQKIVVLGTEMICIGSLNWLSAAQDSIFSNVEFSVVLQGPQASKIIQQHKFI